MSTPTNEDVPSDEVNEHIPAPAFDIQQHLATFLNTAPKSCPPSSVCFSLFLCSWLLTVQAHVSTTFSSPFVFENGMDCI